MSISTKRTPALGAVVIGALSPQTLSRVEEAVSRPVRVPGIDSEMFVIEAKTGDPKEICAKVSRIVGDEAIVAPLLVDDDGHRLIPTGRFQVRFKQPPSDDLVANFAQQHQLSVTRRNKWNPKQVEFTPQRKTDRHWPEVADEITSDASVEAAWPDVMASFKRQGA